MKERKVRQNEIIQEGDTCMGRRIELPKDEFLEQRLRQWEEQEHPTTWIPVPKRFIGMRLKDAPITGVYRPVSAADSNLVNARKRAK